MTGLGTRDWVGSGPIANRQEVGDSDVGVPANAVRPP